MYSWEIKKLLEARDYLIDNKEFLKIVSTSPQIIYQKYDKEKDDFYISTDDKYNFKFKVKTLKK